MLAASNERWSVGLRQNRRINRAASSASRPAATQAGDIMPRPAGVHPSFRGSVTRDLVK
jgi:hypothetical protein